MPEPTPGLFLQFLQRPIKLCVFRVISIRQSHIVTFMILHMPERRIEMKEPSGMTLIVQVKGGQMGHCACLFQISELVRNERSKRGSEGHHPTGRTVAAECQGDRFLRQTLQKEPDELPEPPPKYKGGLLA